MLRLRDTTTAPLDAWIAVPANLRFGSLRGRTTRAFCAGRFGPRLAGGADTAKHWPTLIAEPHPWAQSASYADVSIEGRGSMPARIFLLFAEQISTSGDATYRCDLVQNGDRRLSPRSPMHSGRLRTTGLLPMPSPPQQKGAAVPEPPRASRNKSFIKAA